MRTWLVPVLGLLLASASIADPYSPSGGDPFSDFRHGDETIEVMGEGLLSLLDDFAEMSGQMLDLMAEGQEIVDQGQAIIDGFRGDAASSAGGDLTLGTMCLSHGPCSACAQSHVARANNAYTVLRDNRTRYDNTMRKYHMLDAAASGAARGHQAAGAAYSIQQATQIEPAREKYMTNLRKAQNEALSVLGRGLFEVGACELEHLGVNTFQAISRNTVEIMRTRFVP